MAQSDIQGAHSDDVLPNGKEKNEPKLFIED